MLSNKKLKQKVLEQIDISAYYTFATGVSGRESHDGSWGHIHCPFPEHDDKTPSFKINVRTGHFKCFGQCDLEGSIFDFHMKMHGVDFGTAVKQLCEFAGIDIHEKEKTNHIKGGVPKTANTTQKHKKTNPQKDSTQDKTPDMDAEWDIVLSLNFKDKFEESVKDLLCGQRNISEEEVRKIFDAKLVRTKQYHGKRTLAFAYKTIEGKVLAIQAMTLDGNSFSFTEKNGDPTNKIFLRGSKPGQACFFFCGASHEDAEEMFLYESIIDALTGAQCYPKGCHIAIGGSTYLKKLKDLKPHTKQIKKFNLCFDNDAAGDGATQKAAKILGVRSHTVQWPKCYREGIDINDKLKAGDAKGIVDLITNAVKVEIKKADKKKEPQAPQQKRESDLPLFIEGEEQLRDDTRLGWGILIDGNKPPVIFENSTGVVMVKQKSKESETRHPEPVTPNLMRCQLSKVADFVREKETKDGSVQVAIPPFKPLCENMLEDISPDLPFLKGIITSPSLNEDGFLHREPGYSEKSQCILDLSPGLIIPDIPTNPTTDEINQARELICELVEGFPFTSEAERAHAITLLLIPFVRAMIPGMVPMLIIEASTPGTGKTLLVRVLTYIFEGRDVQTMTIGKNDEETRKKITAKAMNFPAYLFLDNIKYKIDSATIAAFITSGNWEDRLLGQTKMVSIPITCALVATGNNITMSSEIARRSIRSKQDARLDRPWERTGEAYFKHPDLMGWAKKHRGELIGAVLTLVQAWISAGCPAVEGKRLGGFKEWSDVIGGILSIAGIPGFLENLNDFYEESDAEGSDLRLLISAWYRTFGCSEVGVADLYLLVIKNELPIDVGDRSERSQKTKLGQLLRQLKGRRFSIKTETEDGDMEDSTFQIIAGGTLHRAQQWKLKYEKCEPQDIGSHDGSHTGTTDNSGECEPCEPCELKLNPTHAHIHTPAHAHAQANGGDQKKGSQGSHGSQNVINIDSYVCGRACEPTSQGSHSSPIEADGVII